VNGNNTLEEEIRERIVKGNKAFYANRALFKSRLVSIKSKLKLYWSVIRPVVVYSCETWVLTESIIQRLSVFEKKILRKAFGSTKEDNGNFKFSPCIFKSIAFIFRLRPRRRWGDNIKMDLQEVGGGCEDWMELAQDRDRWRALMSTVMNLWVPKMRGIS
jgi:hypothetical protein